MSDDLLPENLLPDVYREKVAAQTKRYHVGLTPNGPAGFQTFAGICFPVYTSLYDETDNEFKRQGDIVELTTAQIRKIKEAIRNRVVRWTHYPRDHKKAAERKSAQILDVRCTGFEPEAGDEPLVKYVYFKEAPVEFQPAQLPVAAFEAMDRAVAAATVSEERAAADPQDAVTRAQHSQLKATGRTLGDTGEL